MCKTAGEILTFESEVILSGLKVQFTCYVFTQSSHLPYHFTLAGGLTSATKPSQDNMKVKLWTLSKGAFAKSEWTRQLPRGFKWNCINGCPAILSTGSQCELCWKIYFGELGFSIQSEKTDCCSNINQTRTLRWLCFTSGRSRVHGLKQAI